jgi:hypothetical protein
MKQSNFTGNWNIVKMSDWDEEYCNMEVQAYIKIGNKGAGEFQFGLVSGLINGDIITKNGEDLFDFTWEGCDECDKASGDGWMKIKEDETGEGEIRFHGGDKSTFWAKKKESKNEKSL